MKSKRPIVKEKYSAFVARNEMSSFQWSTCSQCHESVIVAMVTKTQRSHCFDTKPVGGTEMNRMYQKHWCKQEGDE